MILSLANEVIEFDSRLHTTLNVAVVVFNYVVPRDSANISCTASVFLENMTLFNKILSDSDDAKAKEGLKYNHLRGFFNQKVNRYPPACIRLDNTRWHTLQPRVHKKYQQRMRFAIMDATSLTRRKRFRVSR